MYLMYLLLFCRAVLIRQLKEAQHNLMNIIMSITSHAIPQNRASRDFRAKYPDDVLLDQINGKTSQEKNYCNKNLGIPGKVTI